VQRSHLEIEAFVSSPLAAGLACLTEDEKQLGVTLIDMGAGCTTVSVFVDGELVFVDSASVGGAHVTNDVARGLSTTISHAERLKTLYGSALPSPSDEREILQVPLVGEDDDRATNQVPRSMLGRIIRPRIEEIFEIVRAKIYDSGLEPVAGRRVVLTGGASQLQGLREVGAQILDKQLRLGRPIHVDGLAEIASGPSFSACAGLISYLSKERPEIRAIQRKTKRETSNMFGKFGLWLRENF
jgi:cell division protein FtsA